MIKILISTILLSFVIAPSLALNEQPTLKSGPFCELCTLVLGAAKNLLQKNETEEQVLGFIEKELCGRLGPLNGTCIGLLETYGKEILTDLANGLDPETVCKKFSLCATREFDASSLNCTLCKLVMTQIENLLQNNQSQAEIISYLESHVCSVLGPLASLCKTIVDKYAPIAIKLLSEKIDPEKVCEIIGLCSNTTVSNAMVNRLNKLNSIRPSPKAGPFCELCTLVLGAAKNLLQKNETEEQVLGFIEKELCGRLGPLNGTCIGLLETYGKEILTDLANGIDPETVCKKFNLCATQLIRLSTNANPLECTVCQYVIQFVDAELGGNKTEAAVVATLEKVCNILPASVKTECQNLVSTYGVYLVQLIIEFADPLKVCQALKVC